VDDLRDDGAQGAEAGLVGVRVEFHEVGEVAVSALPEGRLAWVAGAVELHGEELPLGRRSIHLGRKLPAKCLSGSVASRNRLDLAGYLTCLGILLRIA
jgi:hypothetical protein